MEFFDSYAHYDDDKFNQDRKKILEEIYAQGVTKIITAGYSIKASRDSIKLAEEYPYIYSICGISPNDVPANSKDIQESIEEIEKLANNPKVVAIGEIGLDYYWNKENKEIQKSVFIKQIELANKLNLPIVIHTREAVNDTIDILKNTINANKRGVFHCCPLNQELVKQALKLGYYISFAGPVTFKNSKNAQDIIQMVPIDKILIETDSPYLSPEPNRGKRNDSRNLIHIAKKIAETKNMEVKEIAKITYENTIRIFEIK